MGIYASSQTISYKILLNQYLKNNKTPKAIVYYFHPTSPYKNGTSTFEKTFMILKYGNFSELANLNVMDIIESGLLLLNKTPE